METESRLKKRDGCKSMRIDGQDKNTSVGPIERKDTKETDTRRDTTD